jgi:hypothetical protein
MSIKLRIISAMKRLAEEQLIAQPPFDNDPFQQKANVDSRAFALLVAHPEDDPTISPFTVGEAALPFTADDIVGTNENVRA